MWKNSEPNGDRRENCAVLEADHFNDLNCGALNCGLCDINSAPIFVLRGLCSDTIFDLHYGWTGEITGGTNKYNFRGFEKSLLSWNTENNYWKLEANNDPKIYAICNETKGSYPFGSHNWFIHNDTACINDHTNPNTNVYSATLSFSACTEDQYNCQDGSW